MPDTPRVCAVVVTFQRLELLQRLLTALRGQSRPPETILVVDNGSNDGTAGWLDEQARRGGNGPALEVFHLPDNRGPAGGFAAGLANALERSPEGDFTHLWVMDDDVDVDRDCLRALLAAIDDGLEESLFPSVRDETGRTTRYPGWSAVLLPVPAVRRAGLPRAELFWWIEDTEYLQWRLPRLHEVEPRTVAAARARHGVARGATAKPPWKYYYEVRNTVFYRLYVQDTSWRRRWGRMTIVVCKAIGRVLLREPHKGRCLAHIARGVGDGVRRKLGKQVDPARG